MDGCNGRCTVLLLKELKKEATTLISDIAMGQTSEVQILFIWWQSYLEGRGGQVTINRMEFGRDVIDTVFNVFFGSRRGCGSMRASEVGSIFDSEGYAKHGMGLK